MKMSAKLRSSILLAVLFICFVSSFAQPKITISTPDSIICYGECTDLITSISGGTSPYSYQWDTNPIIYTQSLPPVCPVHTRTFELIVIDNNGLKDTATITIHVNPLPNVNAGEDQEICIGKTAFLQATGGINYNWSPAVYLSCPTCDTTLAAPTASTLHTVVATDANGCLNSDSILVSVIENCDSVWPGDANYDGIVNMKDLLNIGVLHGKQGAIRAAASINWKAQYADDWVDFYMGINDKNADCDGNGEINDDDTLAVIQNYNFTHPKSGSLEKANSNDPTIRLVFNTSVVYPGQSVAADIMLGDNNIPIDNIYGITFGITYNHSFISDANGVHFTQSNSWLGTKGENLIALDYNHFNQGKLDIGLVRTDQQNVAGQGIIGKVYLTFSDNIFGKYLQEFPLSISNVKAILADGSVQLLNTSNDTITVDNTTGIKESVNETDVLIFPNPTSGVLNISLPYYSREENYLFTMSDITGREVSNVYLMSNKSTLNIEGLPKGIYIYTVTGSHQSVNGKLVIK